MADLAWRKKGQEGIVHPVVQPFAERFRAVQRSQGPLVWGLDPAPEVLRNWGLDDSPEGLERFVDIVLGVAVDTVGLVKPQSAFYERHGWRGIRSLTRLCAEARAAGLLVILDAKRGDVGSTNDAYAEAYLGEDAAIEADALTVSVLKARRQMTWLVSSRTSRTG